MVAVVLIVLAGCCLFALVGYRLGVVQRIRLAIVPSGKVRSDLSGIGPLRLSVPAGRLSRLRSSLSSRRTLLSLLLLVGCVGVLVSQTIPVISGSLQELSTTLGLTFPLHGRTDDFQPVAHSQVETSTASARTQRIAYHTADQYDTEYQRTIWGPSACSGIVLVVVMNAYGTDVRVVDVIQKELDLGVWSVELGLLREEGLAMTANQFGYSTDASRTRSLQEIITIANQGRPVIVSIRDTAHFPTGHFIVIWSGDDQVVNVVDSSSFNFQQLTHDAFIAMWQTYSAVLSPK